MAALMFVFVLTLSTPLFFGPFTLKLAEAGGDRRVIRNACHTSEVPEICKQCLYSDPGSAKADAAGIADILIHCLMSHSSYLARNMSKLASNPELKEYTKSAYQHCFLHCSDAKKALNSASLELKNRRYDNAELSLRQAALNQGTCRYDFRNLTQIYVPPNVSYDLRVFDILTLTAFRVIENLWLFWSCFHLSICS